MKASIDRSGCISCGACWSICPEVFRMANDGFSEVYVDVIREPFEESALEARDNCPVSVITVE